MIGNAIGCRSSREAFYPGWFLEPVVHPGHPGIRHRLPHPVEEELVTTGARSPGAEVAHVEPEEFGSTHSEPDESLLFLSVGMYGPAVEIGIGFFSLATLLRLSLESSIRLNIPAFRSLCLLR